MCSSDLNDQIFQYSEMDLSTPSFRKFSFFLDWRFVERYEAEAAKLTTTGNPNVAVLQELVDQIQHAVNGLVVSMDKALLAQTVFGTNVTTGNNLAKTININKDGSVLDLSAGLIEVLSDAQENEFVGDLILVGNGLFNKFEIAKMGGALNGTGNALNLGAFAGYKWYNDINSATTAPYGANAVAAFAKGTVGYIDIDRYVAWKTGKFGTSWFTQIMLPVESGDGTKVMTNFNLQIVEKDCPSEQFDGYNETTVDRGYQVIISKRFGLFQQPANSYQAGDRLVNNNGSLIYNFTNNCDPCTPALL